MNKISLVFLLIFLMIQCTPPEMDPALQERNFYDITTFLNQEVDRLEGKDIRKTVSLNGKSETKSIAKPDYKKELSEFYSSNINKKALVDRYKVVESASSKTYKALDDDLEVRDMTIQYPKNWGEGDLTKIIIHKEKKNLLNEAQKVLYYSPKEGFAINSKRKAIGDVKADTLKIEVQFLD